MLNTPQGSSAIASIMERATYDVEAQVRTSKVRCEEVHGAAERFDHKVQPFLVRRAAWQNSTPWSWQMETPARKVPRTTLRGHIAEFMDIVHFRNPHKSEDMPELDDRWSTGCQKVEEFCV